MPASKQDIKIRFTETGCKNVGWTHWFSVPRGGVFGARNKHQICYKKGGECLFCIASVVGTPLHSHFRKKGSNCVSTLQIIIIIIIIIKEAGQCGHRVTRIWIRQPINRDSISDSRKTFDPFQRLQAALRTT